MYFLKKMDRRIFISPDILEIYHKNTITLVVDDQNFELREFGPNAKKNHFSQNIYYSKIQKQKVIRVIEKHTEKRCKFQTCDKKCVWKSSNVAFRVIMFKNTTGQKSIVNIEYKSNTVDKFQFECIGDVTINFKSDINDINDKTLFVEFNNENGHHSLNDLKAYGTVKNLSVTSFYLLSLDLKKLNIHGLLTLTQKLNKPGSILYISKANMIREQAICVCNPKNCIFDHKNTPIESFFAPIRQSIDEIGKLFYLEEDTSFAEKDEIVQSIKTQQPKPKPKSNYKHSRSIIVISLDDDEDTTNFIMDNKKQKLCN